MPQLYSKIIQSKKVDEIKPLKEMIGLNETIELISKIK